jgi:K(+)-stimulated pyrophosphate-energized sodium pump
MSLRRLLVLGLLAVAVSMGTVYAQDEVSPDAAAGTVVAEATKAAGAEGLKFGLTVEQLWLVAPVAAVLALVFAVFFYMSMMKNNEGTPKMKEIAQHVREGAYAYLYSQYKVVSVVFVVLFVIFTVLAFMRVQNPFVPLAFLTGGFFSGLCGFLGMKTATNASSRTAQGASESLNKGLQVAFRSGAVMGLVVVGFGLLDICIWYWILDKLVYTEANMLNGLSKFGLEFVAKGMDEHQKLIDITTTMLTFGMGASTQALFARVGGGIYTKAADVGADLVGKVEAGIPEDDPRNPATIADNVGDNVGDVAGMGADLYESYCGAILATAALGAAIPSLGAKGVLAPMIIAGVGIVLSIIGCMMVRCGDKADMKTLMRSLTTPLWLSTAAIAVVTGIMAWIGLITWGVSGSVVAGLVSGCLIGLLTEYYTSDSYKPTQGIAEQAKMGPATAIIDGLAVGMSSSGMPTVVIVIGILAAFGFAGGYSDFAAGLYGIGFAAVGMLATLGFSLATDAYGPIADNAGGNAEMAGLGPEVRKKTDALDMLGNTTAAIGKGFAIGSAALTAMALLAAYLEEIRLWLGKLAKADDAVIAGARQVGDVLFVTKSYTGSMDASTMAGVDKVVNITTAGMLDFAQAYNLTVMNPHLLCGIFVGAMMTFVFCSMTMKAVGRAAGAMVNEVRRQFREIAGIMDGTGRPDYATCVAISTKGAQKEMMVPSIMAIVVPVLVGIVLGVSGVIGLLVGGLTAGFAMACMLNNAGGAWDNAKKSIEKQDKTYAASDKDKKHPLTGKGSDAHKAGVVGDTVGDPFKDTSGPSLNILIKLMTMVSVVFSGVVVAYGDQLKVLVLKLMK